MVAPALSATLSAALSAAAATTLAHGAVATELPLPTAPQLAWQKNEIMALIHFNMATFFKVKHCTRALGKHGPFGLR